MRDTEDKLGWCADALAVERDFVERIAPQVGMDVRLNPAKEHDPYAPDLQFLDGTLGDLKHQTLPFWTSWRYGLDPKWAVTFNEKDFDRYARLYPGIIVVYWLRRPEFGIEGVWSHDFPAMTRMLDGAPQHTYLRRMDDQLGNAKRSYVFDVRWMSRWRKLTPTPSQA